MILFSDSCVMWVVIYLIDGLGLGFCLIGCVDCFYGLFVMVLESQYGVGFVMLVLVLVFDDEWIFFIVYDQ